MWASNQHGMEAGQESGHVGKTESSGDFLTGHRQQRVGQNALQA